jgi:hypothetical protein
MNCRLCENAANSSVIDCFRVIAFFTARALGHWDQRRPSTPHPVFSSKESCRGRTGSRWQEAARLTVFVFCQADATAADLMAQWVARPTRELFGVVYSTCVGPMGSCSVRLAVSKARCSSCCRRAPAAPRGCERVAVWFDRGRIEQRNVKVKLCKMQRLGNTRAHLHFSV